MRQYFLECAITDSGEILSFLQDKQREGFILNKIDHDDILVCLSMIENNNHNNFVYSIDYSDLYVKNNFYFDDKNEYFDIARLNGWKLQCQTNGIGIWINEDCQATPFYSLSEYAEIKEIGNLQSKREIMLQIIFYLGVVATGVLACFLHGNLSVLYSLPHTFILLLMVFRTKGKLSKARVLILILNGTAAGYLLPKYNFTFALIAEFIAICSSLALLSKEAKLLKYIVIILNVMWISLFLGLIFV